MKRLAALTALALASCGTDTAAVDTAQPATTTTEWAQLGPATHIDRDPTEGLDEELARTTSTTTARASRSRTATTVKPAVVRPVGGIRIVVSTAYCLTGTMANGQRVHDGAVAMNGEPLGARFEVIDGPRAGSVVTVADRIGHGSQFDIWMASCDAARAYGRRLIHIRRVA